ncbi:MAG: hypothetical protein WCB02_00950, partial [Bradyrhizobium sp.]
RVDQRVEEIEAEPDGDDQSDNRLSHGATLLKLPEGERIAPHQRQNHNTERHERNVEHDRLLSRRSLLPRRVSFRSRIEGRGIRIS